MKTKCPLVICNLNCSPSKDNLIRFIKYSIKVIHTIKLTICNNTNSRRLKICYFAKLPVTTAIYRYNLRSLFETIQFIKKKTERACKVIYFCNLTLHK